MLQTIELPPAPAVNEATPPALVGLHIGCPISSALMAGIIPEGNLMAANLVSRILTLALSQDALLEDEVGIIGTLGDGVAYIFTCDAQRTIAALKDELDKILLLSACQIGIRTNTDWQCVHPAAHINMAPLMDVKRLVEANRQYGEMLRRRRAELIAMFKLPLPPDAEPPTPAK